jgi:osmotically inducible lipoprotein OsmB
MTSDANKQGASPTLQPFLGKTPASKKMDVQERKHGMRRLVLIIALAAVVSCQLAGCMTATHTQRGAMGGAVVGGLAGQLLGGDSKSTLIGAGLGALGGALLNDHRYNR